MEIEGGNPEALTFYGYALEYGEGVETNKEKAIEYYKMPIEKGRSVKMLFYGKMLFNNKSDSENKNEWKKKLYKISIDDAI